MSWVIIFHPLFYTMQGKINIWRDPWGNLHQEKMLAKFFHKKNQTNFYIIIFKRRKDIDSVSGNSVQFEDNK